MQRSYYLKTIVLLLSLVLNTQAQQCKWIANAAFGQSLNPDSKMAIDAQNNLYVVGSCNGTLTVGTSSILPSAYHSFLTAHDDQGNILWSKTWAFQLSKVQSVVVDAGGDILVYGKFSGSLTIDNLSVSSAGLDLYLAKFDNTGNLLWLKKYGGTGDEGSGDIYADVNGNVYLCGPYTGNGPVFGTYTLPPAGEVNTFVVKLDASGNVSWARAFWGPRNTGNCLSADANGHVYVGGSYVYKTSFDTYTLSAGAGNFYLAQLNATNGYCTWVKALRGVNFSGYPETIPGICTDSDGNIYCAGTTDGDFSVGSVSLATTGNKGFIAKFDSIGNVDWLKEIKSGKNCKVRGIAYAEDSTILITGDYLRNIIFDTYTVTGIEGDESSFVAKLDEAGNFRWFKTPTGYNFSFDICTNNLKEVYFSGISKGSINLDTISNNPQYTSLFLAKMLDNNLVGLNENELIPEPIVYPNPNNGNLTIEAKREQDVLVINMMGQVVLQQHLNVGTNKLSLTEQEKGIYFIQIKGTKISYKVIKE